MIYINEVIPKPMSKEESKIFFENWNGESWKTLAERNIRLAINIANSFYNTGIDENELFSISLFGLVKSAKKFNPNLGYKFSTYATSVIRNEIIGEIKNRKRYIYSQVSLNDIIEDNFDECTFERKDLISDCFNVEDIVIFNDLKEIIKREIKKENKRDKEIIILFLNGERQKSIGKKINVSQSQVSRIIKRFKNKLWEKLI